MMNVLKNHSFLISLRTLCALTLILGLQSCSSSEESVEDVVDVEQSEEELQAAAGEAAEQVEDEYGEYEDQAGEAIDATVENLNDQVDDMEEQADAQMGEVKDMMGQDSAPAADYETGSTYQAATSAYIGGSDAKVHYVTKDTQARASASNQAQGVGRIPKGTVVLAKGEGDWAQMSNGHYIRTSHLSPSPVARHRAPGKWRSQK